jgi:queuine tRNA-ribosyltransferase
MPVGTQATVKTISNRELLEAGAEIILSNTYHLFLRPGEKLIGEAGGLHRFMSWSGPILTDSGGFQVFSLPNFRKVTKDGVEFKSHIDGMKHFLTPENVVRIQQTFGSDILMPLDECLPYPSEKKEVERSMKLTLDWASRSKAEWQKTGRINDCGARSQLFGIVQGGMHPDLRAQAAQQMIALDFPGYSIGGLSVGEPNPLMYEVLHATLPHLPVNKPRYLMGVGMPMDLFEAVSQGVDMFDCVVPTRNGRNATIFTRKGKLLLRGASYTNDFGPIEENCPCYACLTYTRAYIRHLFNTQEYLAGRLASLHNLTFFIQLLRSMRQAIINDRFTAFRREFESDYQTNDDKEDTNE